MIKQIRTADLFYGAYLMCNGARLKDTSMGGMRMNKVFFRFTGDEKLLRLAITYTRGEATVNLRNLKSSLKHLKDLVHEKIDQKSLVPCKSEDR